MSHPKTSACIIDLSRDSDFEVIEDNLEQHSHPESGHSFDKKNESYKRNYENHIQDNLEMSKHKENRKEISLSTIDRSILADFLDFPKPKKAKKASKSEEVFRQPDKIDEILAGAKTIQDQNTLLNLNKKKTVKSKQAASKEAEQLPSYEGMPKYDQMNTPDLKDELKKFGIKPLSKKQAVKKLFEIFEFTNKDKVKNKSKMRRSQSFSSFNSLRTDSPSLIISKPPISQPQFTGTLPPIPGQIRKEPRVLLNVKASKKNTAMSKSEDQIESSKKLKKTKSDLGLNKHLENWTSDNQFDDEYSGFGYTQAPTSSCTQTQATPSKSDFTSSQKPLVKVKRSSKVLEEPETIKLVEDYIKSEKNVYLKILNYEAVDFEKFLHDIQDLAAQNEKKINNKTVMKILDEFCVTFTLKNISNRNNSKVKTKKKN
jgi:hypothetical protein